MKYTAIIPAAGAGTQLKSQTHTKETNTRELERLKKCVRMSILRKERNEDWLNVLEEYDELRKKTYDEKGNINISIIIRQI